MKTICGIDTLIQTDVPEHLPDILRGTRGLDKMSWCEALAVLDARTIMRVLDELKWQLTEDQRRDVRELTDAYVIRAITQTEATSGYPVGRKRPRAALMIQKAMEEVNLEASSLAVGARHSVAAVADQYSDQYSDQSRVVAARKDELLFQETELRKMLRGWDAEANAEEQKRKGETT